MRRRGTLGSGVGLWLAILPCVWPWPSRGADDPRPIAAAGLEAVPAVVPGEAERRKLLDDRLEAELQAMAQACSVSDPVKAELEEVKAAAIEAALKAWKGWAADLPPTPSVSISGLDSGSGSGGYIPRDLDPLEQPLWKNACERLIAPAPLADWRAAQEKRRAKVESKVKASLETGAKQAGEAVGQDLTAKLADWRGLLGISEERLAELQASATRVAEGAGGDWKKEWQATLAGRMVDEQENVVDALMSDPGAEAMAQRQRWDEELRSSFTEEERGRWEKVKAEQTARQLRALGRTLLAEMEARVPFTSRQRERLQPLVEQVVAVEVATLQEAAPDHSIPWDGLNLAEIAGKAPEKQLGEILDPDQCRRWVEACEQKDPNNPADAAVPGMPAIPGLAQIPGAATPRAEAPAPKLPAEPAEPESFEGGLSDFLESLAQPERKRRLSEMAARVQDAVRVAKLPPASAQRLRVAAQGATEHALVGWKAELSDVVRSQVQPLSNESVQQQVARIGWPQLLQSVGSSNPPPQRDPIWESTLQAVLTGEQRASWKTALAEREQFAVDAYAGAFLTAFDQEFPLSQEQWEKMAPLVATLLREYHDDFFRDEETAPTWPVWPELSTLGLSLISGLPKEKVEPILGVGNFARWVKSEPYENAHSNWESFQQDHLARKQAR